MAAGVRTGWAGTTPTLCGVSHFGSPGCGCQARGASQRVWEAGTTAARPSGHPSPKGSAPGCPEALERTNCACFLCGEGEWITFCLMGLFSHSRSESIQEAPPRNASGDAVPVCQPMVDRCAAYDQSCRAVLTIASHLYLVPPHISCIVRLC